MLSVIVITKNEEDVLKDCLESIKDIADEVIVVDSLSTDKTVEIAKELGAKVYENKFIDFSKQRNFAFSKAQSDWILYIDADERLTKELAENIKDKLLNNKNEEITAYKVKRKNFYFWKYEWPYVEKLERLFRRDSFKEWKGIVHETPVFEGKIGELDGYLSHYTHQDLSSMLEKTNKWSEYEAELRLRANHPKMSWWRFLRVILTGFFKSYFLEKGYKNGTAGLVEVIYQSFSMFITYAKLWEKQASLKRKP